jgi:quercetin dioxygenase-like cupin family protein
MLKGTYTGIVPVSMIQSKEKISAEIGQEADMDQEERAYFVDLANAPRISPMPGLKTTLLTGLHGEKMMMVLNATLPGHTVPRHSHPHEQIGMVYAGKAILRIGEEERIAQKGDFYRIPADVPHSDTCIGDEPFVMLDIFYPVRQDFIEKLERSMGTDG